jgi:copper oxidase (laccase) domain-containing protein
MQSRFNTKAKDLYAGFSPAIRGCCYEVGEELRGFFPGYAGQRRGRYYLDLAACNRNLLHELGVKDINIFDSAVCTSCRHQDFFSYRKEGNGCGRTISVLMLK